MPTRAERDHVGLILIGWYQATARPSGTVTASRIGFSANPRKWDLTVATELGEPYEPYQHHGNHREFNRHFRLNAHITATLPHHWLHPPTTSSYDPHDIDDRSKLIIGIEHLTPPADLDAAELLHIPYFEGDRRSMKTQLRFRFTKGDTTWSPAHHTRHRRQIHREMNVAADQFRQYLAEKLLHRIKPQPSLSSKRFVFITIDETHKWVSKP